MQSKIIPQMYKTNNSLFSAKSSNKEKYSAVSFTGAANYADFFSNKLLYKKLCTKEKFQEILGLLDSDFQKYFEDVLDNLRKELEKNSHLSENIPEEIKTFIKNGNVIRMPEKGFVGRALDAILAPVNFCVKSAKKLFTSKDKLDEIKKFEQIKTDFANIEGIFNYFEKLKKPSKKKIPWLKLPWTKAPEEKALTSEDLKELLQTKIRDNFIKSKSNYSSNLSVAAVDAAALFVAAIYNGLDFYNITRRVDDNHDEAMKEAKLKIKQDLIKVAIALYSTYIVTTLFSKTCNKNMRNMLAVAALIQIASEIINRKITGRPFLPFNEKTLQKYYRKQKEKSQKSEQKNTTKTEIIKPSENTKVNSNKNKNSKNISFTGSTIKNFFAKEVIFAKNEIKEIMELTEKIYPQKAEKYSKLIEENLSGDLKGKNLSDIYSDRNINEVSLGKKESTFEKLIRNIFIPITGPVNFVKKIVAKQKNNANEFIELKKYLAFVKRLLKTKYKNKNIIGDPDTLNELRRDVMNAYLGSFRITEANYDNARYAIFRRISTYAIFIACIATDAYNVTMIHSNGDKKKAREQAKQRAIQDLTRFFISIYNSSVTLSVLGDFYNRNLGNVYTLTLMKSTLNNYLTRTVLGLPILPRSKEQLEQFDEKNQKSSFHRFINKLTGKDNN